MTGSITIQVLALLAFCGLAAAAMISDLRSFRIPNRISFAVAALFPVYAFAGFADLRSGLFAGGIVFAIGLFLFARGLVGGGDVKLLTAVSFWAGTELILPMIMIVTLAGGLLSLAEWLRTGGFQAFLSRFFPKFDGAFSLAGHREQVVVPYGVAIFAGAFYVAMTRAPGFTSFLETIL